MAGGNQSFWRLFARNRAAVFGFGVIIVIITIALIGPYAYPRNPYLLVDKPFLPPFGKYLFGTDALGRDVAAGLVYAARTSLLIGLVATACAVLVGTFIGGTAGYFGGRTDAILMRFTELFQTIPPFIFAIVLVAILQPSIKGVIIAIALVSWPPMARLVRGDFLAMRHREFVQACISLGMSDARVILFHVLPNCLSSIIVTGSLMVGTAILTESGLSFLGLGDPNIISWGFMIGVGREFLQSAWWLTAIPGIAILFTVLAINLVGDGLNDALNPRL